jgi:hypothetical protein
MWTDVYTPVHFMIWSTRRRIAFEMQNAGDFSPAAPSGKAVLSDVALLVQSGREIETAELNPGSELHSRRHGDAIDGHRSHRRPRPIRISCEVRASQGRVLRNGRCRDGPDEAKHSKD